MSTARARRVWAFLPFVIACAHGRPGATASNHALEPGPFAVATLRRTLVDSSRPTAPNRSYRGAPARTLVTQLWYPAAPRPAEWLHTDPTPVAKGEHPLVVYSHGFMSFNTEGRYLAEHLASLGYVVIATDYPLTNYFAPGGPSLRDVVNQPRDVSYLIDTMLSWSADPTSIFAGAIDPKRIGVAGVSLGGMTSMLVAFHPTMGDPRVGAVVAIAGPNSMFGRAFFDRAPKPFLMIEGDIDAIVPYDANAAHLQDRAPFATVVTLKSGSHAGYADITRTLFALSDNPDHFGCDAMLKQLDTLPSDTEMSVALGGTGAGIIPGDPRPPCSDKRFPRAMRPVREQDLATLAATSFLESVFGDSAAVRDANRAFLQSTLPAENDEVTISLPRPGP